MSVPNQTPYIIYNANGLTTVFPYEFYIISASDIQISLNGEVVTTGYTVSGVGKIAGGDVTFLTPPASGTVVMLERVVPAFRLTDYQDNGDLLADTVNKDFDRLWMAIQGFGIHLGLALRRPLFGGPYNAEGYRISELADPVNDQDATTKKYVQQSGQTNLNKTLRVPESFVQTVQPTELRRNKLFAWDNSGNPISVLPESGSAADVMIELAKPTGAGLIGTKYGSLDEYLENTPSILATKYMTDAELSSVLNRDRGVYIDLALQMAANEAAEKGCGVFLPPGDYVVDKKVNLWTGITSFWGDGGATLVRSQRSYFLPGSTTDIDPNQDRSNMLLVASGASGNISIHGLRIDGNARNIQVGASGSGTSIPDQTRYIDVCPTNAEPYDNTPDGVKTPVPNVSWSDHRYSKGGINIFDCVFYDSPGSCIGGNMRNIRIHGNSMDGWYDHAVYTAGATWDTIGQGALVEDIAVIGNSMKNRVNTRGNGCIKGRCGFTRLSIIGNNLDVLDNAIVLDMPGANGNIPWGQITVSGNNIQTQGIGIHIVPGTSTTPWINTGWMRALNVNGNTIRAYDRIMLIGTPGVVIESAVITLSNNVMIAPIFMTNYAQMSNCEFKVVGGLIATTGTTFMYAQDSSIASSNSSLGFNGVTLRSDSTSAVGFAAIGNFNRINISNCDISNINFATGAAATELRIRNNKTSFYSGFSSMPFIDVMTSDNSGLMNFIEFTDNEFTNGPSLIRIKCSSNCFAAFTKNKFYNCGTRVVKFHSAGYTPKSLIIRGNTQLGGVLFDQLQTGVSKATGTSYAEFTNNYVASTTPGTSGTATILMDDGVTPWLSQYENVRVADNMFKDAANAIQCSGSAVSGIASLNKLWFGDNSTTNSTATCQYPTANKSNTDMPQNITI